MFDSEKKILENYECVQGTPLKGYQSFRYGKGSHVWGEDFKKFLDTTSFFSVANLGHNPEYLLNFKDDLELTHVMGDVYPSPLKARLIEKLSKNFHYDRVQLCITGTDAVDFALKTVNLTHPDPVFISFENSYHGLSHGALSVTNYGDFKKFKTPYKSLIAPFPDSKNMARFEAFFKNLSSEIHGIIIEPVLGRGGEVFAEEEGLKFLRNFADERNVPLIFDEIYCGFFRISGLRASSVKPDLLVIGKALANGYPISAVLGSKKYMDLWPMNLGEALHTGTFVGFQSSLNAALLTLQQYEEKSVLNTIDKNREELKNLSKKFGGVGEGFLYRFPVKDPILVMEEAKKKQIILLPSGNLEHVSYCPPLTSTLEDHYQFFDFLNLWI